MTMKLIVLLIQMTILDIILRLILDKIGIHDFNSFIVIAITVIVSFFRVKRIMTE